MKKINVVDFYNFGRWMALLSEVEPGKITQENIHILYNARMWLELVSNQKETHIVPFSACLPTAKILFDSVDVVCRGLLTPNAEILAHDVVDIRSHLHTFETVFAHELPLLATYFASQKRILSTPHLIEKADDAFEGDVKVKVPKQCLLDIREAGRSIAFEIPTGAGFLAVRALEAVVADYVNKLGQKADGKTLGALIKILQANGADAKAIAVIDQIRDLRRNPIAHPYESLAIEDAINVFQLCIPAITELVRDMEKRGLFSKPQPPTAGTS